MKWKSEECYPRRVKPGLLCSKLELHERETMKCNSANVTKPFLLKLNILPIEELFRKKVLVFVYRCVNLLLSSPFYQYYKKILLVYERAGNTRRITRGQGTRLLQIRFQPGPSGRSSICFVGSVLWNELLGQGMHSKVPCKPSIV